MVRIETPCGEALLARQTKGQDVTALVLLMPAVDAGPRAIGDRRYVPTPGRHVRASRARRSRNHQRAVEEACIFYLQSSDLSIDHRTIDGSMIDTQIEDRR
jgi:hypothetical protein